MKAFTLLITSFLLATVMASKPSPPAASPANGASGMTAGVLAFRKLAYLLCQAFAWFWGLLAGIGGLYLLIEQGPLPITNGWFVMFSGISACPLTTTLLNKFVGVHLSLRIQFLLSMAFILAGRLAVVLIHHKPFLPR